MVHMGKHSTFSEFSRLVSILTRLISKKVVASELTGCPDDWRDAFVHPTFGALKKTPSFRLYKSTLQPSTTQLVEVIIDLVAKIWWRILQFRKKKKHLWFWTMNLQHGFGFQSGSYTLVRLDHRSSFWQQKRQWVVLSPFHQPLQPRTSSSLTVVPWLQSKVVSLLQPLTSSMDGSFRFNLVGGGSIECCWRAQTFAIPVFFSHLGILRAHPRFHTSLYWSWRQQDSDCVAVSLNCTRFQSHSRSLKIQTSTFHWLNITMMMSLS